MSKVLKRSPEVQNVSNRRSIRRINKLLEKNLSQFKIPNPYRSYRSHPCLPQSLSKQLAKLDYLSIRTLQNLQFKEVYLPEEMSELLVKMRVAVKTQSEELSVFMKVVAERLKKELEQKQMEKNSKKHEERPQGSVKSPAPQQIQSQNVLSDQNSEHIALPLVMHQSQGASMMSDNYQTDKLTFNLRNFMGNQGLEHQQPLESYQI